MSYCRATSKGSDVYVIRSIDDNMNMNFICFCAKNGSLFQTPSREVMIRHLLYHRMYGQKVPDYAFDRLRKEIKLVGDER